MGPEMQARILGGTVDIVMPMEMGHRIIATWTTITMGLMMTMTPDNTILTAKTCKSKGS